MFLLGVRYDRNINKAVMIFLDDNGQMVTIPDTTGHNSYFYVPENEEILDDDRIKMVVLEEKYDRILKKNVILRKVVVRNPLDVRRLRDHFPDNWESNIRYNNLYIYDRLLLPSIEYTDDLIPNAEYISDDPWENLLGQPIPFIPMSSLDIEVDAIETMPDPEKAEFPISCVSLVGFTKRTVWINTEVRKDPVKLNEDITVKYMDTELELIKSVCKAVEETPVVLTYNGMNFDFPYIYYRGLKLGLTVVEMGLERHEYGVSPKYPIHLDLYLLLSNATIQNYVYGSKYKYMGLGDVSKALLGQDKKDLSAEPSKVSTQELVEYNLHDTELVLDLMRNNNEELLRVLITLSRICKLPIEDVCIWGTNKWVRSMLVWEHKKNNYLLPNRKQLGEGVAQSKSITKGKKFQGALVLPPKKGLHFNIRILDVASLYTTIISQYNLSYETMNCEHDKCKNNRVPGLPYWYCTIDKGVNSEVLGELRNLRVTKIKPRAKKESLWQCISQGVKTILNASYGVAGMKEGAFYSIAVAESVTAFERYIMGDLFTKARELGMDVLGGDTDSIMLSGDISKVDDLILYGKKTFNVDLEAEKDYVWLALTDRKKNYFGLNEGGEIIIKGLQGKKIHTPPFVTRMFRIIMEDMKLVKKQGDMESIGKDITAMINAGVDSFLTYKNLPVSDFEFRMLVKQDEYKTQTQMVDKKTGEVKYRKVSKPQHIRAAEDNGGAWMGRVVKFVKTVNGPKPTNKATVEELDMMAYFDIYQSSLEQVLDALGMNFDKIVKLPTIVEYIPPKPKEIVLEEYEA